MENAKKFFEEVVKTEEAKALFDATEKPGTEEARIAAYVDIANKLGIGLTVEEVKEYLATSIEESASEIDDTELGHLVGGKEICAESYKDRENCWRSDACDNRWTKYSGYLCKNHNRGANLFASLFTSVANAKDSAEQFVKDHNLDS